MNAIWSGAISFGLVNIPVRLYSGSEDHELHFKMLHKTDLSPIHYLRVCGNDAKEVAYKDIVRGYEYQKDQYVVLSDKDFESANVHATHAIDILEFTDEKEIDIRYFEKPYYLEPEKGAEKPYALLREALKKSKKIAIGKFVLRNREHLAAIKAFDKVIVLDVLRFNSQIRDINGMKLPESSLITAREMQLALELIDKLTTHFSAKDFHDTYTEDLEKIIANKIKGRKIVAKGKIPTKTNVKNLMDTLKASLKKSKVKQRAA